MATESSEGEGDAKLTGGNQLLVVDDDLREMGKKAAWSVSSCKAGNGVSSLRDDNLDTYWQSDGAQPHLVNVQFQRKVQSVGSGEGERRKEGAVLMVKWNKDEMERGKETVSICRFGVRTPFRTHNTIPKRARRSNSNAPFC